MFNIARCCTSFDDVGGLLELALENQAIQVGEDVLRVEVVPNVVLVEIGLQRVPEKNEDEASDIRKMAS